MFAIHVRRWELMVLMAVMALFLVAAMAQGGPSTVREVIPPTPEVARTWVEPGNNRFEMWETLQRDADLFVLGQELTAEEYERFVKALPLAVAREDISLVRPAIENLMRELKRELVRHLGDDAAPLARMDERTLVSALNDARIGTPRRMNAGVIHFEVGIVAYRHWKTTFTQTATDLQEERLAMPATYQTYVRLWLGPH